MKKPSEKLAVFYKALGHPARLQIVQKLLVIDSCLCKDFVTEFKWAQPTVSEHLNKLKKAGLVSHTIKGVTSEYSLNKEKYREFLVLQYQVSVK
ncbi:MAG: regulatory protein ArsR [Bacteroidetes bacterium]|jgi:DNA-binding transcriptional ArsR family regulator|nr:regulatory protein ArsR [Bacteroidota bacterium]